MPNAGVATNTSPNVLDGWTWHKDDFEKIFGRRTEGAFARNWPKGTRIVVLLTFDTQGDIDADVPGDYSGKWPGYPDETNFCDLTMRLYDVTEGVPRILRLLARHEIQATFPLSGMTCDWYPEMAREIADAGHEIAVHGYHHVEHYRLDDRQEREEIERALEAVQRISGEQPQGWRTPIYTTTARTLDILRDLGFVWNSDLHDCDFPYVLTKDGRDIIEIPAGLDDWSLYLQGVGVQLGGVPYGNYEGVLSSLVAEFDYLYDESANEPRMFQLCMHPNISGRPFRTAVLDGLISHMKERDGVWFATCAEVAALAH
jgi:peptidoglycan-N-acetylglucosamine deacetylase